MNKFHLTLLLFLSIFFAAVCRGDATWTNSVPNTPDAAYDWSDAANWQDAVPDWSDGTVTIRPSKKPVFIKTPAGGVTVQKCTGNDNAFILGDVTIRQGSGERAVWEGSPYLFGDLIVLDGEKQLPYLTGNLCGRLRHYGSMSSQVTGPSGAINFWFNRYANAAGETRTDDFDEINYFGIGNGTITFYAPNCADASTSAWTFKQGSPYAAVKDAAAVKATELAVGATATAAGFLPEGTFLKRIFTDGLVEFSAPALADGDADVSFAAFVPAFHATFKNRFKDQGADVVLIFKKNDARSIADIEMPILESTYNLAHLTFGAKESDLEPGRFVIRSFSGNMKDGWCALRKAHLLLDAKDGADALTFPATVPFTFPIAGVTTVLEVPVDKTATLSTVTNLTGNLQKEGAGKLVVGLGASFGRGGVHVKAGALAFLRNETVPEGTALAVGDVVLEAGTTLEVPADGLRVDSLKTTGAATIKGGVVTIRRKAGAHAAGDLALLTFADGGGLSYVGETATALVEDPAGEVVGHPAFWVDASKVDTMTLGTAEDGTKFLSRWNDCRADETMFCTNMGAVFPAYTNGATRESIFVHIRAHNTVCNYAETEQLAWSVPLEDVRAVFLVQDPRDGGGDLLGRTSRVKKEWSWGGPFYRAAGSNMGQPLVLDSSYTAPSVRYGKFYMNGVEVVGRKQGYTKNGVQLVECHVNPEEYSWTANGVAHYGLCCDAFGGSYLDTQSTVKSSNGGLRISECIVYTNSLTYAERVKVEKYLMNKWCDVNPSYAVAEESFAEPTAGVDDLSDVAGMDGTALDVAEGATLAAAPLASGTLVKTGAGAVFFHDGISGGALDVRGGSVEVAGWSRLRFMPSDTWLHVDAMEADTLQTAEDGETLVRWSDVHGCGNGLVNYFNDAARAVKVTQNGVGGDKPSVDLGASQAASAGALVYSPVAGGKLLGYDENSHFWYATQPKIKTAFAVYNAAGGGGPIFGGTGNEYPMKGLQHGGAGEGVPYICEPNYLTSSYFGMPAYSNALVAGTAIWRRNGVDLDPFVATFSKGDERVVYRHDVARFFPSFGAYGQSASYKGGLKYGEIALYPRALTDDEIARVDAYLAWKWFGVSNSAYESRSAAVRIAAGASVTIKDGVLATGSLGGGGTFEGDAMLDADGIVTAATEADGSIPGLTVNGTLTFDGGRIVLDSAKAEAAPGVYPLLTATKLVDGGGAWTVSGSTHRKYSARVVGNALVLTVREYGTVLIVK